MESRERGEREEGGEEKLPGQQDNVEVEQLGLTGVSLPLEQPATAISSSAGGE